MHFLMEQKMMLGLEIGAEHSTRTPTEEAPPMGAPPCQSGELVSRSRPCST